MALDIMTTEPVGDKANSDFFNEYRLKIYERRRESGLEDLLGNMRGLVIQVEHGDAPSYLQELYRMTPYRFDCARLNETHRVMFLSVSPEQPRLIVLEPLSASYEDDITRFNMLYPRARPKPNARYVGEIFATRDLEGTKRILKAHDIRFHEAEDETNPFFANEHFAFTYPSDFTGNRIGYTELDLNDVTAIGAGAVLKLTDAEGDLLKRTEEEIARTDVPRLVLGPDHMATRILSGEREDAILEFLTMSNYYFWGAYNTLRTRSILPPRSLRPTTRPPSSIPSKGCRCRRRTSSATSGGGCITSPTRSPTVITRAGRRTLITWLEN